MNQQVAEYLRKCVVCDTCETSQQAPQGLMGRRIVNEPWSVVAADIMGPFPPSKSGYVYLLVFQDLFTKWIEVIPLKKADGPSIIKQFEDSVIFRWGTPRVILTDNGTEFSNKLMREMANSFGIIHTTTPPYHAQGNPVERVNRVLKSMIICFIEQDHREWDLHLAEFRSAYNNALHSSLHVSPAFLNFGRNPRDSLYLRKVKELEEEIAVPDTKKWAKRMERMTEIYDLIHDNLDKSFEQQARYYNQHHRDVHLEEGDVVRRKIRILSDARKGIAAKLARKWSTETFRVHDIGSELVFEVLDEEGNVAGRHHVKDLKLVKTANAERQERDDDDE